MLINQSSIQTRTHDGFTDHLPGLPTIVTQWSPKVYKETFTVARVVCFHRLDALPDTREHHRSTEGTDQNLHIIITSLLLVLFFAIFIQLTYFSTVNLS